jgi:toxin ParE1/3/4
MAKYKLSKEAEEDLIRIHNYGVEKFGMAQADNYFYAFFDCFEDIAERPNSFPSVDYIRSGYRRCVCGVDTIYYRVNKNTAEIMAIIGRQDVGKALR